LQARIVFHSFPYDIAIPGLCNPIHDVISLAGGQVIQSSEQRRPAAEVRGVNTMRGTLRWIEISACEYMRRTSQRKTVR
jgi:hypothetical protein